MKRYVEVVDCQMGWNPTGKPLTLSELIEKEKPKLREEIGNILLKWYGMEAINHGKRTACADAILELLKGEK